MKSRNTLLHLCVCCVLLLQMNFSLFAQSAAGLRFSQSVGTYTPLVGGTVINSGTDDDEIYTIPLPVPFNYLGASKTEAKVTTNGVLGFPNATNAYNIDDYTTNIFESTFGNDGGAMSIFGADLRGHADATISHGMDGDEFVVQWSRYKRYSSSYAADELNMQIRLNTITSEIKFVYGTVAAGVGSDGQPSVGVRGASASDFQNRSVLASTGAWVNSIPGTSWASKCYFNGTTPGTLPAIGTTFTYSVPSCDTPSGVTLLSLTDVEAQFTWTSLPAALNGYEYYYSTSSIAPNDGFIGTDVSTNTVTLSGLQSTTQYFLWVRNKCSATDLSNWSNVTTFFTPCAAFDIPYVMDMDIVGANDLPLCTSEESLALYGENWIYDDSYNPPLLINYASWDGDNDAWFYTAGLNLEAGLSYRLKFDYVGDGYSPSNMKVAYGMLAPQAANMTEVLRTYINFDHDDFITEEIDFVPATTGVYYIGFRSFTQEFEGDMALTNISVKLSPTCLEPTNLVATALTNTSFTLGWTPPTPLPADGYEYYYSLSSVVPTAATVASGATMSLSVPLTTLVPSGSYNVWVRSVCSSSDKSEWSSGLTVVLPQVLATLPYTQDFENGNDFGLINGGVNQWVHSDLVGNPGNSIFISDDNGVTHSYNINRSTRVYAFRDIALPTGASAVTVSFDWMAEGEGSQYDYLRAYIVPLTVMPEYNVAIPASGRILVTPDYLFESSTWQRFTSSDVNVSNLIGGMRLVFEWRNDGSGGDNPPGAIDNVSVAIVTCTTPLAVTVSNVTTTSATYTWTAQTPAPADGYEYYLSTSNVNPTATTPATGLLTSNSINLTDLDPGTTYYFWVRGKCSATENSLWTTRATFSTNCVPVATLPWTENFDATAGATSSFTSGVIVNCWKALGRSGVMTDGNSYHLTRSGDKALAFQWGPGTNTYAITPGFELEAGTSYRYSFYYANEDGDPFDSLITYIGQTQTAAGMTRRIGTVINNISNYSFLEKTIDFTVPTNGIYYIGMKVRASSSPMYLSVDDCKLELTPCANPTAVLSGGQGGCSVQNFTPANVVLTGVAPWNLTFSDGTTTTNVVANATPYSFHPPTGGTYTITGIADATCAGTASGSANFVYAPTATYQNNITICDGASYEINGNTYSTAGTYYDAFRLADNCDSMVVTTLVIGNFTAEGTYSTSTGMLTATPVAGASYTWINCTTGAVVGLSANYRPTANGDYKVQVKVGDCTETSACVTVANVSVTSLTTNDVTVFPNPTLSDVTVQVNGQIIDKVVLVDQKGQVISTFEINDTKAEVSLSDVSEGMYFLHVYTNGSELVKKVIRK